MAGKGFGIVVRCKARSGKRGLEILMNLINNILVSAGECTNYFGHFYVGPYKHTY